MEVLGPNAGPLLRSLRIDQHPILGSLYSDTQKNIARPFTQMLAICLGPRQRRLFLRSSESRCNALSTGFASLDSPKTYIRIYCFARHPFLRFHATNTGSGWNPESAHLIDSSQWFRMEPKGSKRNPFRGGVSQFIRCEAPSSLHPGIERRIASAWDGGTMGGITPRPRCRQEAARNEGLSSSSFFPS